jgi:hypothetical protein
MTVTVEALLAQVDQDSGERFSPTRYPYTYACDFLRNNTSVVPLEVRDAYWAARDELAPSLMSRAQASGLRQAWAQSEGMSDDELAAVLADAYLAVNRIQKPEI